MVLSVPLGILAARSQVASNLLRPAMDFMQTMPAFVYLIPTLFFWGIGVTPGIVSTIVFAMPPGVRLTELGIRQVDKEMVEAGHAFGAPPGEILRNIQLPLAMPTIMAGVNQVIMLSLSMVVIAGIVGAGGLGGVVYSGITRLDLAKGFEGGLAVTLLAVYLDRVTSALGARSGSARTARKVRAAR
jgi:glycine betaine/proline transport system permease protein